MYDGDRNPEEESANGNQPPSQAEDTPGIVSLSPDNYGSV
jgi:hypothetical protein